MNTSGPQGEQLQRPVVVEVFAEPQRLAVAGERAGDALCMDADSLVQRLMVAKARQPRNGQPVKLAEATETPASRATSRIPPGCGSPLLPAMMLPGLEAPPSAPDQAYQLRAGRRRLRVPVTWRRDKHAA